MKIMVCIGSSCHLKGSRQVVEGLQALIAGRGLKDRIELAGTFCMGLCQTGVNVRIGEEVFSVQPDGVESFFDREVMPRLAEEETK